MTVTIRIVPCGHEIARMARCATNSLRIASPFITKQGVKFILATSIQPQIITKVTGANLAAKSLDAHSLESLLVLGASIRSIPNLHAKVYLVDDVEGLVTSSNLTGPGLLQNVELGLHFVSEPAIFEAVSAFYDGLWKRATPVTLESLDKLLAKLRSLNSTKGVWSVKEPSISPPVEKLVPAPVIGYLDFPVSQPEAQPGHCQAIVLKKSLGVSWSGE